MEPIITAIVTALATKLGETAISDAYSRLKTVITEKFGKKEKDVVEALVKLEDRPESVARKAMLQEELERCEAGKDNDILQATQVLLTALREHAERSGATGVELENIKAAALNLNKVFAGGKATGVKVKDSEFEGDVNLTEIVAGETPPK